MADDRKSYRIKLPLAPVKLDERWANALVRELETVLEQLVVNLDRNDNLRYNLAATASAAATDDFSQGYNPGSLWIDIVASPRQAYLCLDSATGAAVWTNITVT